MLFRSKETYFGMKPGERKHTPVWFNHRMPFKSKGGDIWVRQPIGEGWMELTDEGVLIDAIIDAREVYENVLSKLGWSSGTAARFTEREPAGKSSRITQWPLGLDASLTFGPAEPRNIVTAKSLAGLETDADLKGLLESVANAEASPTAAQPAPVIKTPAILKEKNPMSDEIKTDAVDEAPQEPDENAAYKALEGRVNQLSDGINQILKHMQDTPKVRQSGYFTEDGGAADKGVKSFGDFLMAIKRKDVTRLAKVYNVSQKDLLEAQGTTGGFLVPEEFSNQLLQMAEQASPIMQRVTTVPVGSNAGSFPALDYSVTPTAGSGQTAMAAGLSAATTEEGAALTEDQPGFKQITWRVHKVGGFTQASNELIVDSPQAIEVILNRMFAITIANKNERNVLRGSGAGEPLGILNADCLVNVTPASNNTFGEADALAMLARFKPVGGGGPVWIMHRGVIPDFVNFTSSGMDLIEWRSGLPGTLLSYPILYSEHSPQDDNSGDVVLADLSAYLFFQRDTLTVAFSEHVGFTSDLGTWKFTQRNDGQPWLTAAITLADPQGAYTVSPFVSHND